MQPQLPPFRRPTTWILLGLVAIACGQSFGLLPSDELTEDKGNGGGDGGDGGGGEGARDQDGDGFTSADDCNDAEPSIFPGAAEICNGLDDDCDGTTDEAGEVTDGVEAWVDGDGDSWGDPASLTRVCARGTAYVANGLDCDDADPSEPVLVDANAGSETGDGSAENPLFSIQAGIDLAESCVLVGEGYYFEAINFQGKNLSVTSLMGPELTTIRATEWGLPAVSFVTGEGPGAVLDGFRLRDGQGSSETTSVTRECSSIAVCVDYTTTVCGGGVYALGASPTIRNTWIDGNPLPVGSYTTSGNDTYTVASYGGGGCFVSSAARLEDVLIRDNYADQGGGLFVDETSAVELIRVRFLTNRAIEGGGLRVDGGSALLVGSAFAWNEASSEGASIHQSTGTLSLINVSTTANSSPGGDLRLEGGMAMLVSTIVAANPTGAGLVVSDGAAPVLRYGDLFGHMGGAISGMSDPTGTEGNLSVDPMLTGLSNDGDAANDSWAPAAGSPVINAGDPDSALLDQDGSPNDMGATGGPEGLTP